MAAVPTAQRVGMRQTASRRGAIGGRRRNLGGDRLKYLALRPRRRDMRAIHGPHDHDSPFDFPARLEQYSGRLYATELTIDSRRSHMKTRTTCLVFLMLACCSYAQTNLATLRKNFEADNARIDTSFNKQKAEAVSRCEKEKAGNLKAFEEWEAKYAKAFEVRLADLDALSKDLKKRRDYEGHLAVEKERERLLSDGLGPQSDIMKKKLADNSAGWDALAKEVQDRLEGERLRERHLLLKQYIIELEVLLGQATTQNNPKSAAEVQKELEETRSVLAETETSLPPGVKAESVSARSYPTRTKLGRTASGATSVADTAVLKALRWLKQNQNPDGSWQGAGSPTAMCGFALLCFLGHGETPEAREFGTTVSNAIGYLVGAQDETGRFKNCGGHYVYGHAIATYGLAEA